MHRPYFASLICVPRPYYFFGSIATYSPSVFDWHRQELLLSVFARPSVVCYTTELYHHSNGHDDGCSIRPLTFDVGNVCSQSFRFARWDMSSSAWSHLCSPFHLTLLTQRFRSPLLFRSVLFHDKHLLHSTCLGCPSRPYFSASYFVRLLFSI